MPIISSELRLQLSGGGSNADPTLSLGGVISTTQAGTNMFDAVSGAEAAAGDTEYRCFYFRNTNSSLVAQGAKLFIQANTPSPDTTITVGLGTAAANGTEQTVANESTAPTGVTFVTAPDEANGLAFGDIAALGHRSFWVRRVVNSGAAAVNDTFTLRIVCDTAP